MKLYSFLLLIGVIFFSCSKKDYEATIPSYISIPSITLTTDYATEGSASANITDAWVFVNDDLVGVYELPASFPVLKSGNFEIKVFAGIKDNGISASRARYLLYDPHVEQLNLTAGDTTEITANVQYNKDVKFTWLEDFEGASTSFLYTTNSDTIFNKQSSTLKEGLFSGQIFLEDEMDFFEATSLPFNSIPIGGTLYLEMDFKTNENLIVGVYLDGEQFAHITLNTNTEWRKTYLNLKEIVKSKTNISEVKVFIGLKEEGTTVFRTSQPEIYIDNLKLVHF
ncbi:MAG: hypothetical protein P8Q14_03680 [Vicingaceae bacterium]|nr:hypothetical protein [Vicingaceae bacterium]